jgi:signal transduction histidine kinase
MAAYPENEQRAFLQTGALIAIFSGNPVVANEILGYSRNRLSEVGGPGYVKIPNMEAWLYIALGQLDEAETHLEGVMDNISPSTRGDELATVFLYKGMVAWLSNDKAVAAGFMEEVLEIDDSGKSFFRHAIADLVIALILDERGEEEVLVEEQLGIARAGFSGGGGRFVFGVFLVQLLELQYGGDYSRLSKAVLNALSSLSEVESEWLRATAFAALGELYHRSGDVELAEGALSQSREFQVEARAKSHAAYLDWQRVVRRIDSVGGDSASVYLLILSLLLILLILVLVLRIRTQWMINDRLRESVEASRLAEEAAAQSNRLRRQFVSNVSHEVKTPMSGLVGMASILDELVTEPDHRKYVETIQTCSKNLLVILNDLLDLGRMESGRLEMESQPFKLADTFLYCEQVTGFEARRKGLDLTVKLDPDVPEVIYGDSTRLQQIIVNLLNNAIKFTDKGYVEARVNSEPVMPGSGTLRISVKDTGQGIVPELLSTVFEPFNQRQQEVDATSGNGLGLAISQKLADLMGGVISVESVVDEGSTFTLSLPIEAESSNSHA